MASRKIPAGFPTLLLLATFVALAAEVRSASVRLNGGSDRQTAGGLELIVLHNNDMHARFEQTGRYSNTCQAEDVLNNRCYGGFARVAHKVKEYRDKAKNGGTPVLYLNAGDTYTGTPWFTLYKEKIVAEFLNLLKPDAISLGNHEFDNNVAGLVPFLEAAHFPVLIANMDASREPALAEAKALRKSTIFNVNGVQVGVIGYLTPETKDLAPANEVLLTDEIAAINAEAAELTRQGVRILIALGHSGLERDREIAAGCPSIDVVIGGHSHTFLYSGPLPDVEQPLGPYPVMVKRADGTEVPVVQAYAFTKYLGYMRLRFDATGRLVEFDGTPLLLDNKVEREPEVLAILEQYRPGIVEMQTRVIAKTRAFLNGTCRVNECNLANLITDATVHHYASTHQDRNQGGGWTDVSIALLQGGGVRSSLSAGNITAYDLTQVLPFEDHMVVVELNGTELLQVLEHSVARYDGVYGWGEFLQVSGLRVVYNVSRPAGQRVDSVHVLCSACEVPVYEALRTNGTLYRALISKFLNEGGDGYDILQKPHVESIPVSAFDVTQSYLEKLKLVYPAIEWRVTVLGQKSAASALVSLGALLLASIAVALARS